MTDGMNRRRFLKILGITGGGAAALSGCGIGPEPTQRLLPYLVAPDDQIPGVATWYATTCRECAAGCGLRARVRESPVGGLFEPIRPFDGARPGTAARQVLAAVGAAGFEYALTKAEFGSPPTLVTGVANLTVLNYTAGRWDGWTPFETVNNLGDLAYVPVAHLAVVALGVPLIATLAGWLLAGREPPPAVRPAFE